MQGAPEHRRHAHSCDEFPQFLGLRLGKSEFGRVLPMSGPPIAAEDAGWLRANRF